jgi:glutamate racemase
METSRPIGVFDSGYGGLSILKELVSRLPAYDFLYLGDSARSPYGNRSFETVYQYTLQAVEWFFSQDCSLVVLACNTASAKALRTIQQNDLQRIGPGKRVLGVIRPTTEILGKLSRTGKVGILATTGTVQSESYLIEAARFFPGLKVFQQASPMWVPLVENNEHLGPGADYFVKTYIDRLLAQSSEIDTILLACTHYPLMKDKIRQHLPEGIRLISQGEIVADSLADYLERHPEIETRCSRHGRQFFYTTDDPLDFDHHAGIFYGRSLQSKHTIL